MFLSASSGAVANRNKVGVMLSEITTSNGSSTYFQSRSHVVGMAAQIDQIGGLINLSRDCASTALRIPCVGDELMGFPEEYKR